MANIRVDLDYTIKDGVDIVFNAPCDCSEATGLIVYYPNVDNTEIINKTFMFKDAHNNNIGGMNDLFKLGARIKVNLDFSNNGAYIYNADTNKYIEDRLNRTDVVTLTYEDDGPYNLNYLESNKLLLLQMIMGTPSEVSFDIKLPKPDINKIGTRFMMYIVDTHCNIICANTGGSIIYGIDTNGNPILHRNSVNIYKGNFIELILINNNTWIMLKR